MIDLKQKREKKNSIGIKKSNSLNSHVSPWLTRILYPLGVNLVLPLFFKEIEIDGRENIPQTGAIIVTPTHRSRWDALIVPTAVGKTVSGRDLHFMVTANEVKGLQGWFIRRMGGFPVNTKHPHVDSLHHSIELLQHQDNMLVIFPEGDIFRDDIIHPLKRGVAIVALEAKQIQPQQVVNILPVSVRYSEPYPSWGSRVKVSIGEPLNVEAPVGESLRCSSQKLTKSLQVSLQKLYLS